MPRFLFPLIKYFALLLISLLLLIWLFSPVVIQHYLSDYLNKQHIVLTDDSSIRYNPFSSTLTIEALSIHTLEEPDKALLKIDSMVASIRLYRLLGDTVHFSVFEITGLFISIVENQQGFKVAGFDIQNAPDKSPKEENKANASAKTQENNQTSQANNYQISLPNFLIKQSSIDLNLISEKQLLEIKAIKISDLLVSAQQQKMVLNANLLLNSSSINSSINIDLANKNGATEGDIDSSLSINALDLSKFLSLQNVMPKGDISGIISLESQQSLHISPSESVITIEEFELTSQDLKLSQDDKHLALAIAPFSLKGISLTLKEDQAPIATGTGSIQLIDILAYQQNKEQIIAKVDNLAIETLVLSTIEEVIALHVKQLKLEEVVFSDDLNDELPALASFKALTINSTQVSSKALLLDTVELFGLSVDINIDENKNILGLLPHTDEKEEDNQLISESEVLVEDPSQAEATADNVAPSFQLALNKISLMDTSQINLIDGSAKKKFRRYFDIYELHAGAFDNLAPENTSNFVLKGNSNKYAFFELNGKARPFSPEPFYQLDGLFKEVSLPSLSRYISEALQYELKSGQLDVELDITINNTEIDGTAGLHLRGIELTASADHEVDSIKDKTSIPFNIALGMLKDGDGNVELNIPLEGNTNDPSFGLRGFVSLMIKRATMSAAQEYLMTTFVPYANVVNVAISASNYLLKVRFNDLIYPATVVDVPPEQSEFLEQFSQLMSDKPETQITLCGISVPADINLSLSSAKITEDEIKQLKGISEQRSDAFKSYMVKEKNIASSRLLLCAPEIDLAKDAKPRITFSD
jgi:hypothetical protein